MNNDQVFEDTWKSRKDEWLSYEKNDVIYTAFGCTRYIKRMEDFTVFRMKKALTLPSLGWKYFNNFKEEKRYIYKDKYVRWFVRQSIKGGRCTAFVQYYKSNKAENVFEFKEVYFKYAGIIRN